MHPAQQPIDTLLNDCAVRRQRRSGPGGQHRNKVETGIFITHLPTTLEASATERRSQESNRVQAIFRLRVRLAIEFRVSDPYPPTALWRRRSVGGRVAINASHTEFPAILAEVLDQLAWHDYESSNAAEALACTTSQLIKVLRLEPTAFIQVNHARVERGHHRLK